MQVLVDDRFSLEAQRLALRFACRDCAHRSPRTASCAHGWPDELHKDPALPGPGESRLVTFCKEFELL